MSSFYGGPRGLRAKIGKVNVTVTTSSITGPFATATVTTADASNVSTINFTFNNINSDITTVVASATAATEASASVEVSGPCYGKELTFSFGLPQGPQGPQGEGVPTIAPTDVGKFLTVVSTVVSSTTTYVATWTTVPSASTYTY